MRLVALIAVAAALTVASAPSTRSVSTETIAALAAHPQGGYGLEDAIRGILEADAEGAASHMVAREILSASSQANDKQMEAIGRALASYARALADEDFPASRAIWAEVARTRHAALKSSFSSMMGSRLRGLQVPGGTDGGGLDTVSPN